MKVLDEARNLFEPCTTDKIKVTERVAWHYKNGVSVSRIGPFFALTFIYFTAVHVLTFYNLHTVTVLKIYDKFTTKNNREIKSNVETSLHLFVYFLL